MKKYTHPAMDIIALRNDATLLTGSVPGLGGTLGSGDEILAPSLGDLPPGNDIMNSILPPGIDSDILMGR